MPKYFTLLTRDDTDSRWCIEFGAFDYIDVAAERQSMRDSGTRAKNLRIINTATARQADIDSAVRKLNAAIPVRVHCDSCEMLSINGVACHETGCPNMGARFDRESESWIKQRKCFDCGCTVDSDDPCCSAPIDDESEI